MEPREFAGYIVNQYREDSLAERFGEGKLTEELSAELENLVRTSLENFQPIQDICPVDPTLDNGLPQNGSTFYGDIEVTDSEISLEGDSILKGTKSGTLLLFMLQRPGQAFTGEEIGAVIGTHRNYIGGHITRAMRVILHSDAYEEIRRRVPGKAEMTYGVEKIPDKEF